MKNLKISLSIVIILCTLNACSQEKTGDGLTIEDIESRFEGAAKQYQMLCASCHGVKIGAFVDRNWKDGYSEEYLVKRISEGDEDAGMPAFSDAMTAEELSQMAKYIIISIENRDLYVFEDEFNDQDTFKAEKFSYRLEKVADGLEIPWGMAFLPDGDMLIADRDGNMYRKSESGLDLISNVPPVLYQGQGGLMDVDLHPDFSSNNLVYFSYSKFKQEGGETLSTTAIARGVLDGNTLQGVEDIFVAQPYFTTRHHYGCRIEFDREGYLYISVGDRGKRDINPQALDNSCGKIHRINDDGSIPPDNPFTGNPDAVQSIYSYGHRNPQGMIMNPVTGDIWTHEHGPRGGDEINIIKKGLNYGWPLVSYGINYNGTIFTSETEKEGMEPPMHYWVPSIAPCGMDFIKGDLYPGWEGNLLVGALRFRYLHMCTIKDNEVIKEDLLLKNIGRLRNVKQGPDGYIYIGVEGPGRIYKLVPIG
jgi:glucose/arabinose dehydrogenase